MLPPELSSLAFHDDPSGVDDALAARTQVASPGDRVMVFSALKPGLLRLLSAMGLDVVCVDSSRSALTRARDELADIGDRVTLLAEDPRELEIPDGMDVALVPSIPWRAVLLREDREDILRSVRKLLRPGGVALLDVETPPSEDGAREGCAWSPDEGPPPHVVVLAEGLEIGVELAAFTAEEAADELRSAGFAEVVATAVSPTRTWLVASN